jgi:putative drug exporter of the RND superfamily
VKPLARWCLHYRKTVLALWLVALVGFFAIDRMVGNSFSDQFQLPRSPSTTALNLLQTDFPSVSGSSDQIVLHANSGTLRDASLEGRAQRMLQRVAALPHVQSVVSPFTQAGANQVSKNGTVAFATVTFNEQSQNLPGTAVERVITTAASAANRQLEVALGGPDIENPGAQSSSSSTVLGVAFALVVLGLAFGALFAAFLPLIIALTAIGIGYSITGLLSHVLPVASFATVLGVLLGLGVGVDYALLIVTRHRGGLRSERTVEDSVETALDTAGRSVFFAGITVCIALLGQFALGVTFLYGVAVSAAITVALTMLASLTLLPALLGFFRMKVLSRRQRSQTSPTGGQDKAATGFWRRWATAIERHPVVPAIVALAVVVVIAVPIFSLRLGLDDASSDPASTTTHQAYDLLAQGFGPGFNGPFQLVAELASPADEAHFVTLLHTVSLQPGVVAVSQPTVSPHGAVAVAILFPSTGPQAAQTGELLSRLRNSVIPRAEAGTGLTVFVGGVTAIEVDFAHVLSSKLILFVGIIVLLGLLLLLVVFRSLLIPLVAAIMNLLSIGAALGIMNAIFEWGWGHSLFGISETAPVEVFVPVIMISILFGLSMDYEVFLISRIQEEWLLGRNNRRAVTVGQTETGWVITAAAAIMILVFGSFVFGNSIIIKQFGIGLAGAIVIDAFIIRTVLVPGLMHLFKDGNWWLPGWLDAIIPHHNIATPAARYRPLTDHGALDAMKNESELPGR